MVRIMQLLLHREGAKFWNVTDDEFCIEMLDLLEEHGMLPPKTEVEIEGNRGYRTYKRNKWEKE